MNKITNLFFKSWRGVVLTLCLAAVAFVLYFHRLNNLLPGYADIEVRTLHSASDWHIIMQNPLNVPYKVCLWLLTAVHHSNIQATRIVSACFATLAGLLFFAILRMRSHFYIALIGTVLFVTSAGLMHYGRLGTPQIMQASILALMASVLYYQRSSKYRMISSYGLIALLAILCYIPGMIWFEIFGVVLLRRNIIGKVAMTAIKHRVGWAALGLASIAPLVHAIIVRPTLLRALAGLPTTIGALPHVASNLGRTLLAIGIRGTGNPLYGVGHAPQLNVIELILCIIGLYVHVKLERSDRSVFVIGSIILSIVLISLGGAITFACLIPLLYLLIGRGVNHLLKRWFTVFPRNPIAKTTSVLLVCMMLFFSILYQVRAYFVAWPHYAPTKQVFDHKPVDS